MYQGFNVSTALRTLLLSVFLIIAILVDVKWYFVVIMFTFHGWLMLLSIFHVPILKLGYLPLLLNCKNSSHSLETSILSMYALQIFSFILWVVLSNSYWCIYLFIF